MIRLISRLIALLVSTSALASEADTSVFDALIVPPEEAHVEDFHWQNRLILVFGESPQDPRFLRQLELLKARPDALAERDIRVILDTDAASALREEFRPRGFMMMLIGKDGQVYLRKPSPWDVREISRSVDKMPMRQQEIRDRRAASAAQ